MKLHILGTDGPFPQSGGHTSGYLLEAENTLLQMDLGSGVLSALTARTAPESVAALLLSHWHYDHAADVPVLMYRLQALGAVLPVYAPADPSSPLFRLVREEPCFRLTPVAPGDELAFGPLRARVTAARHPVPAVGFRVTRGETAFGYTGDTNTLPSLAEDFRGCSALLADALFPHDSWTGDRPHLSARLAAELARDAGVKTLVLTHHSPLLPLLPRLREAQAVHPDTVLAEAGQTLLL